MTEHVHDWRGGWLCQGDTGCGAASMATPASHAALLKRIEELETALRPFTELSSIPRPYFRPTDPEQECVLSYHNKAGVRVEITRAHLFEAIRVLNDKSTVARYV